MKIEKRPIMYKNVYIANDGIIWDRECQCTQYESLLKDATPLKNLKFFDNKGNFIDIFKEKDIPHFSYLIITKDIEKYDGEVIQYLITGKKGDNASYELPNATGLWYNDWTEAYSGGNGYNGWVEAEDIANLKNTISDCQKQLAVYQKIMKASDLNV